PRHLHSFPTRRSSDLWVAPPEWIPFLIVQGLKDRVAPPELGHAFRERFGPRVQVADIGDAGHMVFLEQPEPVADGIVSFLRQQRSEEHTSELQSLTNL